MAVQNNETVNPLSGDDFELWDEVITEVKETTCDGHVVEKITTITRKKSKGHTIFFIAVISGLATFAGFLSDFPGAYEFVSGLF
ncbi:hypothetical protein [Photobacterium damselae]|uniref:hypothetical protein n=1 Tax=Photobacterium damselae TaxID=38293 RepID=UPI000D06E2AC|nr:hypothetical protein [Photobacterium damselae]PSB77903.1 hypothetical protein C5F62_19415 [Photobacterium damselae subsp. damselae]